MIRLILEAIKEWVEEVLTLFFKKTGEDVLQATGKYNVLFYGLKVNDTSFDNSIPLQRLIDAIQDSDMGAVIYFPHGEYTFKTPIVIKNPIKFEGESATKMRNAVPSQYQGDSVLRFEVTTANQTFFTRSTAFKFAYFSHLTFKAVKPLIPVSANDPIETRCFTVNKHADTDVWDGTLPYKLYYEQTVLEDINCIDLKGNENGDSGMIAVDYCTFDGFSGFAVGIPNHKYVTNCTFFHCKVGVLAYGYDSMLENNWWCRCDIPIHCTAEHNNGYINLEVSNCWADQISSHFIVCENPTKNGVNTTVTLLINDVWVDMVEGAAIYVKGQLQNSRISGRFSRVGMMYALSTRTKAEYTAALSPYADCISAGSIYDSDINISCPVRKIGQGPRKNDDTAQCPAYAVGNCDIAIGNSSMQNCDVDIIDRNIATITHNSPVNTVVTAKDNIARLHKGYTYDIPNVIARSRSPIDWYPSFKVGDLFVDTANSAVYISTQAESKTGWAQIQMTGQNPTS